MSDLFHYLLGIHGTPSQLAPIMAAANGSELVAA
jgi:hypothetical protein